MAQPTTYQRKFNLTNEDGQDLRTQLDIELNDVARAFLETLTNLALIQRDDGELANNTVGVEQLKAELIGGFNPPEPYQPYRPYETNDSFITDDGRWFIVVTPYTSTVDPDDNLANLTLVYDLSTLTQDAEAARDAAIAARDLALQYRDKAQSWAEEAEDVEVEPGQYSALHHKAKALDAQAASEAARDKSNAWAEEAEDTEVEPGQFSALHHKEKAMAAQAASESARDLSQQYRDKSNAWAEEAEDTEVEPGQYSALHHKEKALDAQAASEAARDKAQSWAEEAEDVEVEPGQYSALHHKEKALGAQTEATTQANRAETEADRAEGYANGLNLPSATGNGGLFLQQRQDETGFDYVRAMLGEFAKLDGSKVAWSLPTSTTVETATAIRVEVGVALVVIPPGTPVTMPVLTNGTDYSIYALPDGTLEAVDADDPAPANSRLVGGFHVFLTGEIAEKSLWDLRWRPNCPNPRAMVLSPANEWGDIYLMDVDYGLLGYSRPNVTIADDNDRPIIPDYYGGDGVTRYGSMSWWVAVDLASAAGKRLFTYAGFTAAAYGVVERQAVGTDPGTTQHQAGHRSACGLEQATGVMWQWGAEVAATGGSGWTNIAEGRGDVYASNLKAVLLGAYWVGGSNAGSRASYWNNAPDNSNNGVIGSRAACGHLNLS